VGHVDHAIVDSDFVGVEDQPHVASFVTAPRMPKIRSHLPCK
jgi:hypothetical protein